MGGRRIREHPLGHQLGRAIGVDRLLGVALLDRHAVGRAIDRGGRGEENVPDPRGNRGADQACEATVLLR